MGPEQFKIKKDRIDKDNWLKKWQKESKIWQEKPQNKQVGVDITSLSADNILKVLQVIGIFIFILGFVLFVNPDSTGYGLVLILGGCPLWIITTLLRGGLKSGVGFLIEVRGLLFLILFLMIIGLVIFLLSFGSYKDTYALWITFSIAIFDVFAIIAMMSLILPREYEEVIEGKQTFGRVHNHTIIDAVKEDISELFHIVFFIGLIVPLLSAGNITVIYVGFFLILGGSLASVIVPLLLIFLRIDVRIRVKFLKKALREAFLVLFGMLIIIGTLVSIPDLSTTAPADGKMVFIIIGLIILFIGTLMSTTRTFADIAECIGQEIDIERERHRKFLEQLRLDRKGGDV